MAPTSEYGPACSTRTLTIRPDQIGRPRRNGRACSGGCGRRPSAGRLCRPRASWSARTWSTSTSVVRPIQRSFAARPMPSCRSSSACRRRFFSGRGTSSLERAAGVPGRTEKAAAKTVSKRTCAKQIERLLELRLGLAAEADDHVRRQHDARHRGAQPLHERRGTRRRVYCRPIRRSTASSPLWTGRCRCSQTDGHSAMAAISRSVRSHGCEVTKRRRGMAGTPSAVRTPSMARSSAAMSGRPSSSSRRPSVALAVHAGEPRLNRQIVPVRVDVLAQQRHLAVAGGGQRPRLVDDFVERAAALGPARERHDAVGARLVAAVDDRQPGVNVARAAHRVRRRAVPPGRTSAPARPSRRGQLGLFVGPQEQVDRRVSAARGRPVVRAHRAAGHDHAQRRVGLLQPSQVAHPADHLLLGRFADRAGVDDDELGRLQAVSLGATGGQQRAGHLLAV